MLKGWHFPCLTLVTQSRPRSKAKSKLATCLYISCLVFDQLLNWVLGKKFQSYTPINNILASIFVFGSIIMGKEPLAELKLAIFKIWLDTRPKMEMHDPNVYPTILGGVSQGFRSPFWDLGTQSQFLKIANFSSVRGSFPIMIDPNTKMDGRVLFMGL